MTTVSSRSENSIVGQWWLTVDRWLLSAVIALIGIGTILGFAASPAVAEHIGTVSPHHFIKRHTMFLVPAMVIMLITSMMSNVTIRRLAALVFLVGWFMMFGTILFGPEIKGATRWLHVGPVSIQPSEFVKPAFCIVAAWMFAEARRLPHFPGQSISTILFAVTLALLVVQPDIGMTVVVTAVWCAQFFLAGMPIILIAGLAITAAFGAVIAYNAFPHVASRIDAFLDPQTSDTYQIDKALSAFRFGGVAGVGPGNGTVKMSLPDAHSDFIFAVAGEEFGFLLCALIVALFAFIVLRCLVRLLDQRDLFTILAVGGLITQFGIQALINMGVNVHLLPTKGMTLPFLSYGGSSLWSLAFGTGMILALLRRSKLRVPDDDVQSTFIPQAKHEAAA